MATLAFLIRQPGASAAPDPPAHICCPPAWLVVSAAPCTWAQRIWLLVPFLGIGLTLWWIHSRARGDSCLPREGADAPPNHRH